MKILLVGVSVRAMAESARRSGYEIAALDAFGDLDLQSMCEAHSVTRDFAREYSPKALLAASQDLAFDAVAYTSNLENYPAVVSRLARAGALIGNSPQTLRRVRHWPTLSAALARGGYHTPETILPGSGLIPIPEREWLVKPVRSGGGHGVALWRKRRLPGRSFLLQEYLPGEPISAAFVADGSRAVVLGMTEQLIGRPEFGASGFTYCGNLLPPLQDRPGAAREVLAQVQGIADLITGEFGLVGVNGIDMILAGERLFVIEVNPRYSASMELIERAYGLPIFDLHYRAATQGELPDFDLRAAGWPEGRYHAKAIVYAERDFTAPDTREWMSRGVRDVPHPGEVMKRGFPVCTVLAGGETREECMKALIEAAERVRR
jgi:predicted ATP-grasp superfamily ATP-dependent carboligase